jgi:hypothetical protein
VHCIGYAFGAAHQTLASVLWEGIQRRFLEGERGTLL